MGGNVFSDKTSSIKREHITPTLTAYFAELSNLFPAKKDIFNTDHFIALGSVGKKAVSGDIDLGVSIDDILNLNDVYESLEEWGLAAAEFENEFILLKKRARSSNDNQLRIKAFLKLLTKYINDHAEHIFCDGKKVTDGNIFTLYPQVDENNSSLGTGVQIDWMVGNLEWLKFSYYSAAYPEDSNVKGLHRTQLMLSAFQIAGLSFGHVTGVKDKHTGESVAVSPSGALAVLGSRLGFKITEEDAENYYKLYTLLAENLDPDQKHRLLCTYFKILDSTRVDIPDNLTYHWLNYKDELGLTGKFLPETSKLKELI
jgi:hypothetical protein